MHNMNDKLVSNSHDQCPAQKFFRSRNKNPNECVEKAKKKHTQRLNKMNWLKKNAQRNLNVRNEMEDRTNVRTKEKYIQ